MEQSEPLAPINTGLLGANTGMAVPEDLPYLVKEFEFLIHGCRNRRNLEYENGQNIFCLLQCAINSNSFLILFDLKAGWTHT